MRRPWTRGGGVDAVAAAAAVHSRVDSLAVASTAPRSSEDAVAATANYCVIICTLLAVPAVSEPSPPPTPLEDAASRRKAAASGDPTYL